MKHRIGITMGDPCGVGPEIILKAFAQPAVLKLGTYFVYADYAYLDLVSRTVFKKKLPANFIRCKPQDLGTLPPPKPRKNAVYILDHHNISQTKPVFGTPLAWAGEAAGAYIKTAVADALDGKITSLVTMPINKFSFVKGGWGHYYRGHTEMLAALSGAKNVALMLVAGKIRSVHVSQHIALRDVPAFITPEKIQLTVELVHHEFKKIGFPKPRIAVCALNPHAGDNGVMGDEERTLITPAILACQSQGILVEGPLPADTLWPQVIKGNFDVGVAMYHDQGQIPVKLLAALENKKEGIAGVNVTLGLPFIRTSVAHGTAFDIAGTGKVSIQSFVDAIHWATR